MSRKTDKESEWQLETLAVHAGLQPDPATGAVMTPIHQTSTFAQDEVGQNKGFEYARADNPTRTALQKALATLEGGEFALAFASGMAAIDTVLRLVKPGDHVVGDSRVVCGRCEFCDRGLPNLCDNIGFLGEVRDGAFTEETVVDQSLLVGIDPGVPFHQAALAEPLAVALHAVSKVDPFRFSRALVIGAGPIGALVHCLLKMRGMAAAHITEVADYRRRAVARRFPGSVVAPEGQYDLVFETTGSLHAPEKIIPAVLAKKGTLVMVGLYGAAAQFDFTQLVEHEWTVSGCAAFATELDEAAGLLAAHWREFDYVVSHQLPLAEGQTAFDLLLDASKRAMKIVFVNA